MRGKGAVGKKPLLDLLRDGHPGLRALHRLDFETSGVLLFAKTGEVEKAVLQSKFAGWEKQYHTLVMGRIQRKGGAIRKELPARGKGTVSAVTQYTVLERYANSSYVSAQIETGRHHQIRRHFAGIDHPLVLDAVYGHRKFNKLFTQELGYRTFFLHASLLRIPHPITKEDLVIEAPLPKPFQQVLETLRSIS